MDAKTTRARLSTAKPSKSPTRKRSTSPSPLPRVATLASGTGTSAAVKLAKSPVKATAGSTAFGGFRPVDANANATATASPPRSPRKRPTASPESPTPGTRVHENHVLR